MMMFNTTHLPSLDPNVAMVLNQFAASHWSFDWFVEAFHVEAIGERQKAEFIFSTNHQLCNPSLELHISGSFGEWIIVTEIALINQLSDFFIPGWRDELPEKLSLEWRAILVVAKCLQKTSFHHIIRDIQVILPSSAPSFDGPDTMSGLLCLNAQEFIFRITFKTVITEVVEMILPQNQKIKQISFDPSFICSIHLPSRDLICGDYRALLKGDAILSVDMHEGIIPATFVTPMGKFSVSLTINGKIMVNEKNISQLEEEPSFSKDTIIDDEIDHALFTELTEPIETFPLLEGDPLQEEIIADGEINHLLPNDPIEALTITLGFQLASHRLSLSELRLLGRGTTLDLNIDLTAPLTITANGDIVGSGQLIQLGDKIGVQITRWPPPKETSHE